MPLLRIIPKTDYRFDGRTNSIQIIPIRNGIELANYNAGVLIVRLHGKAGWSATGSAEIALSHISITPEEPNSFFEPLAAVPDLAKAVIANTDLPGTVYHQPFLVVPGTQAKLVIRWLQGGTAAGANQVIGVGIDLAVRQS